MVDTDTDKTTYEISIIQSAHQTITVTANGNKYTNTVSLPYGTTYTVSITADAGYIAGELNKTGGTITGDETINATSAVQIKPQVYIAKGSAPWYSNRVKDKIVSTDESVSGQATVTCKDITDMDSMFTFCTDITSIDLSNFDTSNVTTMGYMFLNCSKLASVNLSSFNTSNVRDMEYMFANCSGLTSIDVSNFDTSNTKNMSSMFQRCSKLTSLDLSNFNTSKVIYTSNMFRECSRLRSLDISNFDTSNVTDMNYMFGDCTSLTTIKGIIDMKSHTNYKNMFINCTRLRGVKIKNPPTDTDWWKTAGLSSSQYTIIS